MDPITHGLTGALLAKAFYSRRSPIEGAPGALPESGGRSFSSADTPSRKEISQGLQPLRSLFGPTAQSTIAVFAVTLGAVFPDADLFADFFERDGMATLEWHRGITHAIPCLPGWSIVLALVFRWWLLRRGALPPSLARLSFLFGAGIASHIVLDAVTSWGTMIWAPLSRQRVAHDWVFIIDFTFAGVVLLPQLLAWVYERRAERLRRSWRGFGVCAACVLAIAALASALDIRFSLTAALLVIAALAGLLFLPAVRGWGFAIRRESWCRGGIAALGLYLATCAASHALALGAVEQHARDHDLLVQQLGAVPLPPSFLHWDGLIRTPGGIHRAAIDLPAGAPVFHYFPDSPANAFITAARQLPQVQTYLWFSRFPSIQYSARGDQRVVEFTDMRFVLRRSSLPAPFTFRVVFDSGGHVVSQGWALE